MKKFISILLALIIAFSSFSSIASAASAEPNKVVGPDGKTTLQISTDKSAYSWNDEVNFTITVTNISDETLYDVKVDSMAKYMSWFLPSNDGSATIDKLNAGESKDVVITYTATKSVSFIAKMLQPLLMLFAGFAWKSVYRHSDFNYEQKIQVGMFGYKIGFSVSYGESEIGENYFSEPSAENVKTDSETGVQFTDNEILLTANDGVSYETISQLVSEMNGQIVGYIEAFGEYQVRLAATYTNDQLNDKVEQIKNSPHVANASLNFAMNISDSGYLTPRDPWGGGQNWSSELPEGNNWGVEAIKAPVAWDHRDEMNPITIGLIDNGFDINHSDLTFSWTRASNETNNHGTHVAGTMAADWDSDGISGIMPTSKSNGERLVSLIAVTQGGREFSEMFTFEMKSCYAELLLRGTKVINISQGFNWYLGDENGWDSTFWINNNITEKAENLARKYAETQEDFLKRAIQKGYEFVLVCSAGNSYGIDAEFNSPMNAIQDETVKDRIVVVGAINNLGIENHWFSADTHKGYEISDFSNLGPRVDVVAPGGSIYSTVPITMDTNDGNADGYALYDGTSMASPHVAGVAAMVWSINPNLTGAQVKEIVVDTADRPVSRRGIAYNILNAENAVNEAIDSKSSINPWQPELIRNGAIISCVVESADDSNHIENATVSAYASDGEYVGSATTDNHGQFELIIPEGTYTIIAYKDGYMPSVMRNVTVEYAGVYYTEWFKLAAVSQSTSATAKGKIFDAMTNSPLPNVTLSFTNAISLETVTTTTTNSSGAYSVTLPVGYYTVQLTKAGYIESTFSVTASLDTQNVEQNSTMSTVLASDAYRVVLTWGDRPYDLDSHITGQLTDGSNFHVYYSNKNAFDGDYNVANLDVDDTSSYGPETVTLHPTTTGTYRYYIYNYSGNSGGTIAASNAQIKLYKGSSLIATYNTPTDQGSGRYWTVFEITNGVVKPINKMGDNVYTGIATNSNAAEEFYMPPKIAS